jgi:hypothetical protein
MKTLDQQCASLRNLLAFATNPTPGVCNFGAMIQIARPGDVVFLAPIAPELRGVEIVSATPGHDYDIWRRTTISPPMPIKTNLTAPEVVEWLLSQCQHTESEYMQHGANWLEATLEYYGQKRRSL